MFTAGPQLFEATLLLLVVSELRGRLVADRREPRQCAVVHPVRRQRARPRRLNIMRKRIVQAAR